ncbi:MAG: diiron oxygenase [Marmoricola sp.]
MDDAYRSPFANRTDDPDLRVEFTDELHYFSPSLTPLLSSKELVSRITPEQQRAIEVQQLYSYLDFTVRLETEPVNEIAQLLYRPAFIPWLHPDRRTDALSVYRDEAKHADWSRKVIDRVKHETGIEPLDEDPAFLRDLDKLIADEPSAFGEFVKLFFVCVSETLITGSLNKLPKDTLVQESVRNLARAHAADEGQHHKYFKSLFEQIWPTMPYQTRIRIGTLLPSMLRAFLLPDKAYMLGVLRSHTPDIADPERIVNEIIKSPETEAGLRNSATPSLRMFENAGVLDDPIISEAFVRNQFWLPSRGVAS